VKPLLEGKVALITGAFGGLGHEFARMLGEAGAAVGLAGRRMTDGRMLEAELASDGIHALAVKMEVTDRASVEEAVGKVSSRLGNIDILVNNAGITVQAFPRSDGTGLEQRHRRQPYRRLARRAGGGAADARTRNGGSIINISSILAERVQPEVSPYCASKAGLSHLTRAMALELARFKIRVNALAPGYIETPINRDYFAMEAGKALIKRIPQRKLGLAGDLKGALLLLASDQSSNMTGSVITVDGGHTINSL